MHDAVVGAVRQLDAAWQGLIDTDVAEGAHKFRVAARKLRVLLHQLRRSDATGALRALRKSLAKIARDAAPLRDLDMLGQDIVTPLLGPDAPVGLPHVLECLSQERLVARAELCARLASAPMRSLRAECADLPTLFDTAKKTGARSRRRFARRDLAKRWRAVADRVTKLDGMTTEQLHETRKLVKSVRYALGHLADAFDPDEVAEFARRMARAQALFGYLNDVDAARSLSRHLGAVPGQDCAAEYAAGYVLGIHAERATEVRRKLAPSLKKLCRTRLARRLSKA